MDAERYIPQPEELIEEKPQNAEINDEQTSRAAEIFTAQTEFIRDQQTLITNLRERLGGAYTLLTLTSAAMAMENTVLAIEDFSEGKILQGSLDVVVGTGSAALVGISEKLRRMRI